MVAINCGKINESKKMHCSNAFDKLEFLINKFYYFFQYML